MEARPHYSRPLLLQLQHGPAVSPAPGPAATSAVPDAPAADASTFLSAHAALILAVLVAVLALRVVQGALRATRRAGHDDGADEDAPPQDYPEHSITGGGGGGGAGQPAAARHGGKQAQAMPPCLAYTAALELAGSSGSECAICLAAFAGGDAVRVLPRCSHGFHACCVDRWLAARPTCPTCRQAPFAETAELLQPGSGSGAPAAVVPPLVRVAIVGDRVARLRLVEP